MTQEEKAKRYDEAFRRVKKFYTLCKKCGAKDTVNFLEETFSELVESEDERIRKWIIDDIRYNMDNEPLNNAEYKKKAEEAIVWLEKQGDKGKLIQEFGEYKVKYTQEVLEKHINSMSNKDDERLRKTTIVFLKDFAEQGYENAVECIDWLEKQEGCEYIKKDWLEHIKQSWYKEGFIDGKYSGGTPKEWTINDATTLKELIDFLENGTAKLQHDLTRYANWLKIQFSPIEKQDEQKPDYCHHEVDLSNCSEEYRKAYYDGWNNCNMQHSQCKSESNDVVKCLINGMKFYYEDNDEATWGTEKFSMKVKDILAWLEKQSVM